MEIIMIFFAFSFDFDAFEWSIIGDWDMVFFAFVFDAFFFDAWFFFACVFDAWELMVEDGGIFAVDCCLLFFLFGADWVSILFFTDAEVDLVWTTESLPLSGWLLDKDMGKINKKTKKLDNHSFFSWPILLYSFL